MNTTICCGLIVSLLLLSVQAQRKSEVKCREFRQKTMRKTSVIPLVLNPIPITFSSFNCSKTVDLIVGGEDAKPGEFPHQALLGYENPEKTGDSEQFDFQCGGSLISERFVLTAAHCMKRGPPKIVRLGEHSIKDDYDDQVDFDVKAVYRHPDHRFKSSYNDIALIELSENVRFSRIIRPACLWTEPNLNISSVVATGFGLTETAGNNSDILQKVMLNVLNKQECQAQYGSEKRKFGNGIIDSQLCIGSVEENKDTCQGDSGGPIQVVTEPKGCIYHIIGVTSLGPSACGLGRSASIYTQVASYIGWIESVVWPRG